MRSRIEIVAAYRSGPRTGTGRTVVTAIRGGHHFAARETGPGIVHLVGTAAGPLGGDEVEIMVRVGSGASLTVRSAGATIVQPGVRQADSFLQARLSIEDDARLTLAAEPTVVIHRAVHEGVTEIDLAGAGQVRLVEQVVLGRSNEPGGVWTGRTRVTRDGVALLRHTVRSAVLATDGVRVIATLVDSHPCPAPVPATRGAAVVMPLAAGGLLATATGRELLPTMADLHAALALAIPATDRTDLAPTGSTPISSTPTRSTPTSSTPTRSTPTSSTTVDPVPAAP